MMKHGNLAESIYLSLSESIYSILSKHFHLSNEKRDPGSLGYIGDEKLPSYVGIKINHYKDPY